MRAVNSIEAREKRYQNDMLQKYLFYRVTNPKLSQKKVVN